MASSYHYSKGWETVSLFYRKVQISNKRKTVDEEKIGSILETVDVFPVFLFLSDHQFQSAAHGFLLSDTLQRSVSSDSETQMYNLYMFTPKSQKSEVRNRNT
jgi:hypothetical protein